MTSPPPEEPWFETAFRREYMEVYAHRDLESARAEVTFLLEQGLNGIVMDLCCGQGRHLIAMRESGLDAFGLDLSQELLGHSGHLVGGQGIQGFLVRSDQRVLPLQDQTLDGATLLFSSFGYHDAEGNGLVLDELSRVLKPDATLVLDLMNPTRIRSTLVPHSVREERGLRLEETRSLSANGLRVRKEVKLSRVGVEQLTWREDVRLYDREDLDSLLDSHGFRGIRRWGGFDGQVFDENAPRQLVLAQRGTQATSASLYSDA